jgi:hypothetical protein
MFLQGRFHKQVFLNGMIDPSISQELGEMLDRFRRPILPHDIDLTSNLKS